jgi:hypothetical protein
VTAGEWLILVTAGTSGMVSIVNAIATGWGRAAGRQAAQANHEDLVARAEDASDKLDEIHVLTNSNLSDLKVQLAEAKERIDSLEKILTTQLATKPRSA